MISAEEAKLVEQSYSGDGGLIAYLRAIAVGDIAVRYPDFYPKDWRPRSLPMMLWDAANEIERQRDEIELLVRERGVNGTPTGGGTHERD